MDPFIENQEWDDFHSRFNNALADAIMPYARPRYYVRVERRVYVEHIGEDFSSLRQADVAIVDTTSEPARAFEPAGSGGVAIAPVECIVPLPQERRETYLVIRERETHEVVTVIETLSPSNKRPGGDGRREYMEKRESILASQAHLVELDLLRGGARLPVHPVPRGDYSAMVSRKQSRPRVQTYGWPLRHPMPKIPIPLLGGDPEVMVDLQQIFSDVYGRAEYDLSLNYHATLSPPLSAEDAGWVASLTRRIE
jgi:hypothetical protein